MKELGHDTHDAAKYVMIVFMQGEDATEMKDLLDSDGWLGSDGRDCWDALIDRLSDWDYGQETEDAAVVNGGIYDDLPDYWGEQRATRGEYNVVVNWHYNYVALYRKLPAGRQPTI